jgi:hypothetical protein
MAPASGASDLSRRAERFALIDGGGAALQA